MSARFPTVTVRFVRRGCAAVLGLAMAAGGFAQVLGPPDSGDARPTLRARVRALPIGPASDASRASCGAMLPGSETNDGVVGGSVRVPAAGLWAPAYWEDVEGALTGPFPLPGLGHGGQVNAVSVVDGTSNTICFAGSVVDGGGSDQPVAWLLDGAGEVQRILLGAPGEGGGEALGVVSFETPGGNAIVAVCGRVVEADGFSQAALWWADASVASPTFSLVPLPGISPGDESVATALTITLENTMISGYSIAPDGGAYAQCWVVEPDGGQLVVHVSELSGLSELGASRALAGAFDEPGSREVFGGRAENEQGRTAPALWISADPTDPSGAAVSALPLRDFERGQVNSIIAILIGLLVGGDVNGPGGSNAAVWLSTDAGASLFNLNSALGAQMPAGLRLEHTNQLLPYIEQDNVFRAVVDGVSNGASHGVIVDMTLRPAGR